MEIYYFCTRKHIEVGLKFSCATGSKMLCTSVFMFFKSVQANFFPGHFWSTGRQILYITRGGLFFMFVFYVVSDKTVRIETHSSEFGGTFFLQPDRPCFFSESRQDKQKTKIRHMEPGRYDGRQRLWLFLLPVGHPRPFCSRARVYRAMGDAPYRRRHEN